MHVRTFSKLRVKKSRTRVTRVKERHCRQQWCYRTDCDCVYPASGPSGGSYSEFDTEEEAEKHIRTKHQDTPMMFIVPVEFSECNHPRHHKDKRLDAIIEGV